MSDHHVGSENVQTSGERKRKLSTIEEEMKLCDKQISVVKRQRTELFGLNEPKLKEYIEPEIADSKENYADLDQISMTQNQLKGIDLK